MDLKIFTCNPFRENTYILFDETKECVIIDPGMYTAQEQNEVVNFISSNALKPVLLLNTHCHVDHVLGNKFVFDNYGLKPQFHKGEHFVFDAVPAYAPQMGIQYELSPMPDTYLGESGSIHFGNSTLEILFAPGHSPAHLCFYAKENDFLIAGDVLFYNSIGRTDLPGGNHQQLIDSIKNTVFQLPDSCTVYPGHGPSTVILHEKMHNPFLQ